MIRVLSAGFLTTVQDLGRPGFAHFGVSAAGAADAVSLRLANLLVGNFDNAPCLEMTLKGGRFAFEVDSTVAVVGSDFDCSICPGRAVKVNAGEVLEVGGSAGGARCYLAVRGGLDARYDLGSASTHMLSGLGQVVRRGDVLRVGDLVCGQCSPRTVIMDWLRTRIRVTPGAETESFSGFAVMRFLAQEWLVSDRSNRQGVRLNGSSIESVEGGAMESEGVALGAIQVPPGGEPVILFVDSQTTGGYPVIANVAAVDLCAVGQLRPGFRFRFEAVTFEEAHRLLMEQEAWIRDAV